MYSYKTEFEETEEIRDVNNNSQGPNRGEYLYQNICIKTTHLYIDIYIHIGDRQQIHRCRDIERQINKLKHRQIYKQMEEID